jgi:hypothetical protein
MKVDLGGVSQRLCVVSLAQPKTPSPLHMWIDGNGAVSLSFSLSLSLSLPSSTNYLLLVSTLDSAHLSPGQ